MIYFIVYVALYEFQGGILLQCRMGLANYLEICTCLVFLFLHQVDKDYSSPEGVLILDIVKEPKARQLQKALNKISGIETKLVVFKH